MPSLRQLIYDIAFRIDTDPIQRAERAEEGLEDSIERTTREMDRFNRNTQRSTGSVIKLGDLFKFGIIRSGFDLLGNAFRAGTEEVKSWIDIAAEAQESISKFNTVFGDSATEANRWLLLTAEAIGRGETQLTRQLGNIQASFIGFTDGTEASRELMAGFSKQVVSLGIDLGSLNNIATDRSIEALSSGLVGNHDALRALGTVLTENILKQEAYNLGLGNNFQALSELEKVFVRYSAVVNQNKDAIGDAERTSDSYANTLERSKGRFEDLRRELGDKLLPVATDFLEVLIDNSDTIGELGASVANFLVEGGEGLVEFFKDKENVKKFETAVRDVADSINTMASNVNSFFESDGLKKLMEFFGFIGKATDATFEFIGDVTGIGGMGVDMDRVQEFKARVERGEEVPESTYHQPSNDSFKNLSNFFDSVNEGLYDSVPPDYRRMLEQSSGASTGMNRDITINHNVTIEGNGDQYLEEKMRATIQDSTSMISNGIFKEINGRMEVGTVG